MEEQYNPEIERLFQRMKEDLGLEDEAIEVVLNLREQVTILQARLHSLETTMHYYEAHTGSRLTSYRKVVIEAEWEETED